MSEQTLWDMLEDQFEFQRQMAERHFKLERVEEKEDGRNEDSRQVGYSKKTIRQEPGR